MAHRIIELVIGRLVTDEDFRREFVSNPSEVLLELCGRGLDLNHTEISALLNTDPALWTQTADALDPRLQKASLKHK